MVSEASLDDVNARLGRSAAARNGGGLMVPSPGGTPGAPGVPLAPGAPGAVSPGGLAGVPGVDMLRFRPNLVVGGAGLAPFAEDAWRGLALGAVEFCVAGEHVNEVRSR